MPPIQDPLEAHWQYVPQNTYQAPPVPEEPVKRDWRSMLPARWRDAFASRKPEPIDPNEKYLEPLPREWLRTLLPPLPTAHMQHAVERLVHLWLLEHGASPNASGALFLVGPPHSGQERVLRRWARVRNARVIEPPSPEELLAGSTGLWRGMPPPRSATAPGPVVWVLPALERWFLRRSDGLHWLRALLQAIREGHWGCCIIGCDSWAWAYLQHAQVVHDLPAHTLQAFDAARLGLWIERATSRWNLHRMHGRPLRHATPANEMRQALQRLAGEAGGNVFVAYYLWREGLRARMDNPEAVHQPLDICYRPVCNPIGGPDALVDNDSLLLWHALLLHNGLPQSVLETLVPIPPKRLNRLLHAMAHAGITTPEVVLSDRSAPYWRVTPRAYPFVQRLLAQRDFLHCTY